MQYTLLCSLSVVYEMMKRVKATTMSSSQESQVQVLIPSLPNDIAVYCLARIPLSQHRTLSQVSKPIRSLLTSPHFFNVRSTLHLTQPISYLIFQHFRTDETHHHPCFALTRNPSNSIDIGAVPHFPCCITSLSDAAFAVVDTNIYVIGGRKDSGIASSDVWVLDCRCNHWGRGPSMLVGRESAMANVVDGKIYVIGGSRSSIQAEVLDPGVGTWVQLPCPFYIGRPCRPILMLGLGFGFGLKDMSVVMDDKVYLNVRSDQLAFDPRNGAWESVVQNEEKLYLGPVVNGFSYDYYGGVIRGFDMRKKVWKKLKYLDDGFSTLVSYANHTLASADGKLLVIWGKKDEIWIAELEVNQNEEGELWAKVCCSNKILSIIPHQTYFLKCLTVVL